ncbi:hypothetical protein ES703_08542 [subsurface metagenome]
MGARAFRICLVGLLAMTLILAVSCELAEEEEEEHIALASSPAEVYNTISVGMAQAVVINLVDPDYANAACYVVDCLYIDPGPPLQYEPTNQVGGIYWMWVFMPRFGQSEGTVVCFHGAGVTAVARIEYSEARQLVDTYGYHTFW